MKTNRASLLISERVLKTALEVIPEGYRAAVPIKRIVSEMECRLGFLITRNEFQNYILQALRKQGTFVGGGHKGMFLCVTKRDCDEAAGFYRDRIAAETINLNRCLECRDGLPY